MAATLTFLLISSLLQGALCETFNIKMPPNINVLRGSCVTIPCSFDVESRFEKYLDHTCKAYWSDSPSFTSGNAKVKPTKDMTGDLTKKDCTTTFNNTRLLPGKKYYLRLECKNDLKYTFKQASVNISVIAVAPSPTLTPSTLEVKEGTSVSLTCSAPAPCWSHPPALTWIPNRGQSQETLQENQDKTKVKTSVMNFTASHLHHGNKISCTAVYQKNRGSPDVTAETSLTPDISYSPKNVTVSVSPSGPVPENSNVSLTCSSNANPAVRNYTWYRADGDQEALIGTGQSFIVTVSKVKSTFFCKATNALGCERSRNLQIDFQYSVLYPVILSILAVLLPVILCVLLFFLRAQNNPCKPKGQLTEENTPAATSQALTEEGNEKPNTNEEGIYANTDELGDADAVHSPIITEPSSTYEQNSGPNNIEGGSENSEKKVDSPDGVYSNVNWKPKSKKINKNKTVDMNPRGSSYLEEEKCMVDGFNRNFVSNALEMGGLYDEVESRTVRKEVECEYAQVNFHKKSAMQ
ncbi:sialic acid-binding Ig-like lectin 5 [Oreochromis aureus]|uniref:Ig-like domain-containing protein n=1 Tax=Oreochromis aureus TaxID=47969 RepID=A0AAZ1X6M9_OREAU|nr:sialic acid-binding Ig-like lectin 5 [Oreochromis aureus]XP_039475650.1 sialic acid-binding Ig-like lectin 5 [Oreochromis aureus]XP_039475651.1 sialic acid-binding Ig-like lectin 5 [Oreochromis aureus]